MYSNNNNRPTSSSSSFLGSARRGGGGMLMGGGGSVSNAASSSTTATAAGAGAPGFGRMAKYANPSVDGTYTQAHHNTYRHSGWIKVNRMSRLLTEGDLITIFSQFGEVVDVRFATREHDGQPIGFAFLEFLHPSSATIACDCMNSSPIGNINAATAALSTNEAHARAKQQQQQQGGAAAAAASSSSSSATTTATATSAAAIGGGGGGGRLGGVVTAATSASQQQTSSSSSSSPPQPFICKLLPTDAVGIEVDHCDVSEVPPLRQNQEGYGHWFHRVFVGV